MIDSLDSFSSDYREARQKFRAAAAVAGGRIEELRYPVEGPDDQPLYTDIASFGPVDAEHILFLWSGTHGVEGFCGSGAQVDLLRRGETAGLTDIGVVMVHAVNPYGFAWLRRTTHENIDLNRNWHDFTDMPSRNTGYEDLHPLLCPEQWTEETIKVGEDAMNAFAAREGAAGLKNALSGGQYHQAGGLYYGGQAPSAARIGLTRILTHYAGQAGTAVILDYHSGLGPWGYAEQIVTVPRDDPAFARAQRWLGAGIASSADGSSSAARISGDALSAAAQILPSAEVTGIALEYGTLPRPTVLKALRADAWLHHHGDPRSPQGQAIGQSLRSAYYGDRPDWKGMVVGQSLQSYRKLRSSLTTP